MSQHKHYTMSNTGKKRRHPAPGVNFSWTLGACAQQSQDQQSEEMQTAQEREGDKKIASSCLLFKNRRDSSIPFYQKSANVHVVPGCCNYPGRF